MVFLNQRQLISGGAHPVIFYFGPVPGSGGTRLAGGTSMLGVPRRRAMISMSQRV